MHAPPSNLRPPPSKWSAIKLRHGFTMLELVLTMLVMGIMAAITLPRFLQSLDHYRADAGARQLMADLQLAQKTARFTGAAETITFDVSRHQYSFSSVPAADGGTGQYRIVLSAAPYHCSLDRVTGDNGAAITFDGYGFPDGPGELVVSSGGEVRQLNLDAVTGHVTVSGD